MQTFDVLFRGLVLPAVLIVGSVTLYRNTVALLRDLARPQGRTCNEGRIPDEGRG